MMRHSLILAALAAAAGGCASGPKAKSTGGVAAAPIGDGEIFVGAIPDSALPKGECGMVLWTLQAERPAAVFRLTAGKGAEIMLNGKLVKLAVVSSGGATGFGVAEDSKLAADGVSATVSVRFGLGFDGGSYLERGLLTVENAAGWRTVIPAAGIAGCRVK